MGRIRKLGRVFIARRRNACIWVSIAIADWDVEERECRPFDYIRDGGIRATFSRLISSCRRETGLDI